MPDPRILVLISGSGTNLQALLDAISAGSLSASIIHVISNKKAAYGLQRAAAANIPTTYHNLVAYKSKIGSTYASEQEARQAYDAELARLILAQNPELVVCAGWMHIFSPTALEPLQEKDVDIINLHPALPGCFDGKDAIERAWKKREEGLEKTGVMIHYVIHAVDRGEPILTKEVEMKKEESLEELEARIHEVEHGAIVEGTKTALERRKRREERAEGYVRNHDKL